MNSPRFLFTTAAAVAATLAVKQSAAPAPQTAATSSSQSKPLRVYGLSSDNALIRFNANQPKRERFIGYITGFRYRHLGRRHRFQGPGRAALCNRQPGRHLYH